MSAKCIFSFFHCTNSHNGNNMYFWAMQNSYSGRIIQELLNISNVRVFALYSVCGNRSLNRTCIYPYFEVAVTKYICLLFSCRIFGNEQIWIPPTFDHHQSSLQRRLFWAEFYLSASLWSLGWESTKPPSCHCRHSRSSWCYFEAAIHNIDNYCGLHCQKKGFVSGLNVNMFMGC